MIWPCSSLTTAMAQNRGSASRLRLPRAVHKGRPQTRIAGTPSPPKAHSRALVAHRIPDRRPHEADVAGVRRIRQLAQQACVMADPFRSKGLRLERPARPIRRCAVGHVRNWTTSVSRWPWPTAFLLFWLKTSPGKREEQGLSERITEASRVRACRFRQPTAPRAAQLSAMNGSESMVEVSSKSALHHRRSWDDREFPVVPLGVGVGRQ